MRSQLPDENLAVGALATEGAIVGLYCRQLVFKICSRKRMTGGACMARSYICEAYDRGSLEIHAPHILRPVFAMRTALCARASPGKILFLVWPGRLPGSRVLRTIRQADRALGWHQASLLGTRSIRRRAARAAVGHGAAFTRLRKAGRRRSSVSSSFLNSGKE